MPSIPDGQLPKETLQGFLGVNLRQDPVMVSDQELLVAINADLHSQLGTIRLRQGRQLLYPTALDAAAVYGLFRHEGRRYQAVGTTLYRDAVPIVGLLAGNTRPTVFPYQPLNDDTTWSFIADHNMMRKDNGTTVSNWGIAASPTVPAIAAGAAGGLTGDYGAVYTYVRVVGGSVAHESNPCPVPAPVMLASQVLNVPVQASLDPQVTHIRIYRTVANGSTYFFDQQVANAIATHTSSQADDALGTEVETDNDPPPLASCAVEFQGHIFLCNVVENPDYLYFSKRFRPESFPPDQFLKIGNPSDPLLSMIALTGVLGVFTYLTKYRVFGNSVSGFTALEALNSRGVASANATLSTAKGVAFVAKDGIWLTNFVEADLELSQGIQGLFYGQTINGYNPIDVNTTTNLLTLAEYKRRLYFGYRDVVGTFVTAVYSPDTQHWYHYNHDSHVLNYEEDTDQLTAGTANGLVYVMETGTSDDGAAIQLDVACPPRTGGDRFRRKGYEWLGVDSEGAQPWTVTVDVDGATVLTASVQGQRRKRYVRFPDHTVGQSWQSRASYVGTDTAALYALEVLEAVHNQGQVWVEDSGNANLFVQILPGSPMPMPLPRRRFTFLVLDADAAATGVWEADLYVDGTLQASLEIPGAHNKGMHALPPGITGYEWYTRARYSEPDIPLLHTLDVLDTGVSDGQTWIAAPAPEADAYQQILPALEPVNPFILKRFLYLKTQGDDGAGFWTFDLYIDEVLRQQITVQRAQSRDLIRLRPGLLGHVWRIVARYSTPHTPTLFQVLVLTQELRVA